MDSPDPLDAMLRRSAPNATTVTPTLQRDLEVMNRAAEREVTSKAAPVRRGSRVVVGLGLAFALTGTAGAAAAAGGLTWLPWAENPDVAYPFVLPSGRECEGRIVLQEEAADGDWDRFTESLRSLRVDPADVEQVANDIRGSDSLVVVTDDGVIEDRPLGTAPKTDDGTYAAANWVAVKMATNRLSAEAGVALSWNGQDQVQCEAIAP